MAKKNEGALDYGPPIDLPAEIDDIPLEAKFKQGGVHQFPFDIQTAWSIFFDS